MHKHFCGSFAFQLIVVIIYNIFLKKTSALTCFFEHVISRIIAFATDLGRYGERKTTTAKTPERAGFRKYATAEIVKQTGVWSAKSSA